MITFYLVCGFNVYLVFCVLASEAMKKATREQARVINIVMAILLTLFWPLMFWKLNKANATEIVERTIKCKT